MLPRVAKASLAQHVIELVKSVGVAGGRGRQHDEAETSRFGRCHVIGIGNKLDDGHTAAGPKRATNLLQEGYASRRIEVVKKIRDEHDIVIFSEVDLEGA